MRNKIRTKLLGAVAVAIAFFVGITPMTAFAQSKPECSCKTICSEDCVNPDCEICMEDIANCEGAELEPAEEVFGPLTPDGNLSLVDDYGSIEAGGKQFITVVTKKGNYFYIIIDRDDQGDETVHFLNMVDESDLLSLMDDEEAQTYIDAMNAGKDDTGETVTEEAARESTETETEKPEEPAKKNSSKTGLPVLLLFGTIGGIGGFLYLKNNKKKPAKTTDTDPDADYMDDEEDYFDSIPSEEMEMDEEKDEILEQDDNPEEE